MMRKEEGQPVGAAMATAAALDAALLLRIGQGLVMTVLHRRILLRQRVAGMPKVGIMAVGMTLRARLLAVVHGMFVLRGRQIAMATDTILHAFSRMGADNLVRQKWYAADGEDGCNQRQGETATHI